MAADAVNLPGPESLIVADGYGLNGWQQAFLISRSDTIGGGTAEIQRNIIAGRLLGLPKEPRGSA
jgi:alkylation response protein AidB-like acyl-CoA dehydrogenase